MVNSDEALFERATDDKGTMLWEERYIFSRLSAPGDRIVRRSQEYEVITSDRRGAVIETVVKKLAKR